MKTVNAAVNRFEMRQVFRLGLHLGETHYADRFDGSIMDVLYIGAPDPGPEVREEARRCLSESLGELAEAAAVYALRVVFEPVDRGVDQRGLVGRTAEGAALIESLRAVHPNLWLAWDTAHAALSGDDLETVLREAREAAWQLASEDGN